MVKLVTVAIMVVVIFLLGLSFSRSAPSTNYTPPYTVEISPTPVTDFKASFAIFTNGTFRVFTARMYHNLAQNVYIESSNPNIIHVKQPGITWNDFFSTLPFKLTSECLTTGTKETFCSGNRGTLKFYINGERTESALNQEINAGDKLLVSFGNEEGLNINKQIESVP